ESNPALRQDLQLIGVDDWIGVLGYFMLGDAEARRYASNAQLNTDDRLPLEFSAPRALYLDTVTTNWRTMKRVKVGELPDVVPDGQKYLETAPARSAIASVYLTRGVVSEALIHFQRARRLDPGYVPALLGEAQAFFRLGRHTEALTLAQQALSV